MLPMKIFFTQGQLYNSGLWESKVCWARGRGYRPQFFWVSCCNNQGNFTLLHGVMWSDSVDE